MICLFSKNIEDYEKKVLKIILRMQILKGLVLNHLKILHKVVKKNKLELIKGDICKTSLDYIKKIEALKFLYYI